MSVETIRLPRGVAAALYLLTKSLLEKEGDEKGTEILHELKAAEEFDGSDIHNRIQFISKKLPAKLSEVVGMLEKQLDKNASHEKDLIDLIVEHLGTFGSSVTGLPPASLTALRSAIFNPTELLKYEKIVREGVYACCSCHRQFAHNELVTLNVNGIPRIMCTQCRTPQQFHCPECNNGYTLRETHISALRSIMTCPACKQTAKARRASRRAQNAQEGPAPALQEPGDVVRQPIFTPEETAQLRAAGRRSTWGQIQERERALDQNAGIVRNEPPVVGPRTITWDTETAMTRQLERDGAIERMDDGRLGNAPRITR